MLAAADRLVLVVHDRAGASCLVLAEIAGETRYGRDDNDDTELSSLFARSYASIDNGPSDNVVDG